MAFPDNNTMIAAAGGLVSESSIYNRAIEATALVGASTNNVISPSSTVQQLVTAAASLLQDDGGYLEAVRAHYALDIYNKLGNGLPFVKLTTAARLALTPAGVGEWVYDTDLNRYFYWNGTGWLSAGAGGSSDTQVIYNDSGALSGDATFTFNKTTKLVSATAVTTTGAVNVGGALDVTGVTTLSQPLKINQVAGLGGSVRYIGNGNSTTNWFLNVPTGGSIALAVNESIAFTVSSGGAKTSSVYPYELTGSPGGLGGSSRYIGGSGGTTSWYYNALTGGNHVWAINESAVLVLDSSSLRPSVDNSISCGDGSHRWTVVYAASGTINTSDADAKENIEPLPFSATEYIKSLKPVSYKFKDTQDEVVQQTFKVRKTRIETDEEGKEVEVGYDVDEVRDVVVSKGQTYSRKHWGFIAQDVAATNQKFGIDSGVFVDVAKNDPDSAKKGRRYGLRYEELIAVQAKAIQELIARIEKLEGR